MGDNLKVTNISKSENIKNNSKKNEKSFFSNLLNFATMQKDQNKSNNSEFAEHSEEKKENNSTIKKLLKNKQIKVVIIVLIFSLCALFILNSSFGTSLTKTTNSNNGSSFTSSLAYCEQLETKLKNVLNKINGAGNVSVMVTVKSAPELIIASSTTEKNTSNSTTNGGTQNNVSISTDPIIITNSGISSPLILTEKLPEITGIVVVAEGAKDAKVKLSLLQAVQALLDVKSSNIQIYY